MDDMLYVKFVDENIGNGLFAKKDLEPNTILGIILELYVTILNLNFIIGHITLHLKIIFI